MTSNLARAPSAPAVRFVPLSAPTPDQPARPTLNRATVVRNDHLRADYWILRLDVPAIAERVEPGQFAMLTLARNGQTSPVLPRPMAAFSWDRMAGTLDVVYRVVGEGTRILATWRRGETMTVVGPLGRGFRLPLLAGNVLLLGRGVGTCSLTALAEVAIAEGNNVCAVTSGRHRGAIIGATFYRRAGVGTVIEVADDDGSSDPEDLYARLLELLAGNSLSQIFVCGSQRLLQMAVALGDQLHAGVQVSLEAHMACGLGYCHCCSSGARGLPAEALLICVDGPVFRAIPDRPVP